MPTVRFICKSGSVLFANSFFSSLVLFQSVKSFSSLFCVASINCGHVKGSHRSVRSVNTQSVCAFAEAKQSPLGLHCNYFIHIGVLMKI